jgi:sugar lactone lactonase YvrE
VSKRVLVSLCAAGIAAAALPVVMLAASSAGAAAATTAGTYTPLTPARLLDTRSGIGAPAKAIPAGGAVTVAVAGRGGVPATAGAVQLTVTAVGPTAGGHLIVWPHGAARPAASTLNFAANQIIANSAVVRLPAAGSLDVYNGQLTGSVQVVVDVSGYYAGGTGGTPGGFVALTPARLLDTRTAGQHPVAANSSVTVHVAGAGGVPPSGVAAVAVNITAVSASDIGSLVGWDGGPNRPFVSQVYYAAGRTVAGSAIVPVNDNGDIQVANLATSAATHVLVDVSGYFLPGAPTVAGAFQPLPAGTLLDTPSRYNAADTVVQPGATLTFFAGENGVPVSGVTTVALDVRVQQPGSSGNLTVFPSGTARPNTSNLNFVAGQQVANLVLAQVGADGKVSVFNQSQGSVQLSADVVGYVRGDAPAAVPALSSVAGCTGNSGRPCLRAPEKLAVAPNGDVYVADGSGGVRKVGPDGALQQIVPGPGTSPRCATTGDGGPAAAACVWAADVEVGPAGVLYIADSADNRLRKVDADGTISTVAGNGTQLNCGDGGPATAACVSPSAVVLDTAGRAYLADSHNGNVRRVDADGTISRYAGPLNTADGHFCRSPEPAEGTPATELCIGNPSGLFLGTDGLYIAGASAAQVFRVDAEGGIHYPVGSGSSAFCGDGGPATAACLLAPFDIVGDAAGNLYVASAVHVRRVDPTGRITTVAGTGSTTACGDPTPATLGCLRPSGLARTATGQLLIADPTNHLIWSLPAA